MRVIFLDIDGVLNTSEYRLNLELDYFSNLVDPTKMLLLKRITDTIDAEIVLSSTWRKYWVKDGQQVDSVGKYLQSQFAQFGMEIYDKIPVLNSSRGDEIWAWLKGKYFVEEYVILDDCALGWDHDNSWTRALLPHFVQTDDMGGGLTDELASVAIRVLEGERIPVTDPVQKETVESKKDVKTRLLRMMGKYRNNY